MSWLTAKYSRYSNSIWQLFRFGVVGGLGVLVNTVVLVAINKVFPLIWDSAGVPAGRGVWWPILNTGFNVRWYHVMFTIAFLVANVFNFQLNRWWTFRSHRSAGWSREYWPFLTVGLVSLGIGILGSTALLNPESPLALSTRIFDNSVGFRNPLYWANLIMIAVNIPVSFMLNKFWTFRAVREVRRGGELDFPEDVMIHDQPRG